MQVVCHVLAKQLDILNCGCVSYIQLTMLQSPMPAVAVPAADLEPWTWILPLFPDN